MFSKLADSRIPVCGSRVYKLRFYHGLVCVSTVFAFSPRDMFCRIDLWHY